MKYSGTISLLSILLSAVLGAIFAYLLWLEPPYLSYPDLPFKTVTSVRAGEVVELVVKRCSTALTTRVYQLSHTLIDAETGETVAILPGTVASISPGCHTQKSRVNVTPPDTKPWRLYRIDGYAEVPGTFKLNLVHWYSQNFWVYP